MKSSLLLMCSFLMVLVACKAQQEALAPATVVEPDSMMVVQRDDPTTLPAAVQPAAPARRLDSLLLRRLDDTTRQVLLSPDTVSAFVFDEGKTDTANLAQFRYKVLAHKQHLSPAEVDSALQMAGTKTHFFWDDIAKRCEFWPTLGLKFQKGSEIRYVLIATGCDKVRFIHGQEVLTTLESDPSHGGWVAYARSLFPQNSTRFN